MCVCGGGGGGGGGGGDCTRRPPHPYGPDLGSFKTVQHERARCHPGSRQTCASLGLLWLEPAKPMKRMG